MICMAIPSTIPLKQFLGTVLPAKSDCDIMFCLQQYNRLIIDRSLVY